MTPIRGTYCHFTSAFVFTCNTRKPLRYTSRLHSIVLSLRFSRSSTHKGCSYKFCPKDFSRCRVKEIGNLKELEKKRRQQAKTHEFKVRRWNLCRRRIRKCKKTTTTLVHNQEGKTKGNKETRDRDS